MMRVPRPRIRTLMIGTVFVAILLRAAQVYHDLGMVVGTNVVHCLLFIRIFLGCPDQRPRRVIEWVCGTTVVFLLAVVMIFMYLNFFSHGPPEVNPRWMWRLGGRP